MIIDNYEILDTEPLKLVIRVFHNKQTADITVFEDYSNIPFAACLDECSVKANVWIESL
jgi:hypothetical protein